MILPDVNVLIHAFRADSSRHAFCKPWLDRIVLSDARFGISPLALSAVARITTNPRVFAKPSPPNEVFAFCNNLLGQPHCEIVTPGERYWGIFTELCLKTSTRGPRISDAWFAALAIEHAALGLPSIATMPDLMDWPGKSQ